MKSEIEPLADELKSVTAQIPREQPLSSHVAKNFKALDRKQSDRGKRHPFHDFDPAFKAQAEHALRDRVRRFEQTLNAMTAQLSHIKKLVGIE
jgi:hypothetical protein